MIFQDLDFSLQISDSFKLKSFKFILPITDLSISENVFGLFLTIQSLLTIKLLFPFIQGLFVCINLVHQTSKLLADFIYVLVSSCNSFGNFLPFSKQNMSLIMLFLELLSSFIKLDLTCLGRSDLFF